MSLESPSDLVQKLINDKTFRDAFVYEHVKRVIPYQLRAMRKERGWKQGDLGKAVGKPRNVINRLENPNYGKLTLKTLFEIASGCDVALLVKFVPFSRLLKEHENMSFEALAAASVTDEKEIEKLNAWAVEEEVEPIAARVGKAIRDNKTASFTYPLKAIEGKGNTTPARPWLRFMYEVGQQSLAPIESLFGKQAQPEEDEESEAQEQPMTLAMAASGNSRR